MAATWRTEFESPSAAYRGKPFWAWNGELEPAELRRQVRAMHRMGLGGFFMHSRVGLATEYLSDRWFECVNACLEEAGRLKMEAWLYDEDRWPSGAAGGLVTRDARYRARRLSMLRIKDPKDLAWDAGTIAAFRAEIRDGDLVHYERLPRTHRPPALPDGEEVLAFRVEIEAPSNWYNGQTYLDTLNPDAVRKFIDVTHEAYRRRVGAHFGKTVPGIFTDEPNHGGMRLARDDAAAHATPWTHVFDLVFLRRYGYDLLDYLPEIFLDVETKSMSQPRYHYHDCLTFLFVDAFARQIGDWCERHNLQHTGHVLAEESLSSQTSVVGSCMRFYEYMQAPGMDLLTQFNREYDTAKQVSSVARQFGRRWRITETYGCTGWDFPWSGHKALADWQSALGINLRCQHLAWYTMLGEAKRDYPAAISHQSPWWRHYATVEDYCARINVALSEGEEVRDLLVIHPVESMWTLVCQGWRSHKEVTDLDHMLVDLRDSLLAAHLDFDYGDEDILARHGRVHHRGGRAVFSVNKADYTSVLVPPLLTIRASTLALLRSFAKAGGHVIFAGEVPQHVDAIPSDAAELLAAECRTAPPKGTRLVAAVEPARRVSIVDASGEEIPDILYILRETSDGFILFACNTGHDIRSRRTDTNVRERRSVFEDVRIRGFAGAADKPLELDPQTGETHAAAARKTDKQWEIRTSFSALGSRLFYAGKTRSRRTPPPRKILQEVRRKPISSGNWHVYLSEPNVLVLDRPRYRIADGAWRGPDEILRVDRAVRNALGIPKRGGAMVQPWACKPTAAQPASPIELVYRFDTAAVPAGELNLALECPGRFEVTLNGHAVETDMESGWWVDRSLRKIPINPTWLRMGSNELRLLGSYDALHPGLEIVYLLGHFGTRLKGDEVSLTPPPSTLKLGNWVKQGLMFYSGSVTYCRRIQARLERNERLFVRIKDFDGVAARVLINDVEAGIVAWEPLEVEITNWVAEDPVELRIEVLGHRRNSHGPLHLPERFPHWTGPAQFLTDGAEWSNDYCLVACGLTEDPELVVKR